MVQIRMLSDEWLVRYTPLELLELKTLKYFHEQDRSTNERTNERTYKRKDENYIPLGINAGGIKSILYRDQT